ncbi:MAG: hypothetical protein QOD92_1968 [Acidimicrobiaceae bacterium]|jgi:hypothetical protein
MSDGLYPTRSSSLITDDDRFSAVLAHSMLGTVSAIRAAIDTAMAYEAVGSGRDGVLMIAKRRLEFLTAQLRDLAAGVPSDAIVVDLRTYSDNATNDATS